MAVRWRIRHKLMLGLGLVVGIIALLLAGSFYGLARFRATVRFIDCKTVELSKAESVRDAAEHLYTAWERSQNAREKPTNLKEEIAKVREAIDSYTRQLQETIERGHDPQQGHVEHGAIDALGENLNQLDKLLHGGNMAWSASNVSIPTGLDERHPAAVLRQTALDLCSDIIGRVAEESRGARQTFRASMWIVSSTALGGVLFLCALLGSFYRWVFAPIRDLERGAGRLAEGDFEHRIDVHSGDEMEDLAAAFNDMTSRLRETYRDLARQVNERSRQLVRSERLAGVGFLAAGVAHEINNPLASIAFCSEALEGRLAEVLLKHPENREVVTKYLKMIQQEAFRCKAITQRLLEFSRGGERRREPADLVEIIQSVLDVVQHLQNGKGKTIAFEPPPKLVAWVNAQEVKSVVLNLVVNALDSMEEGGTLRIGLAKRDGMAEMVFADTGCGMSAEILENIFEPFFTRSRTGKGTGLGLSISHRVISQHGGEIEATSPGPNRGSTFTVRLPLQPVEPAKEETFGHLAA